MRIRLVPVLVLLSVREVARVEIGVGHLSAPPSRRMPPSAGSVMPGRFEPGSCTSMSRVPTRGSTGCGFSSRDQILEVAVRAGAEVPAVVDRVIRGRLGLPGIGEPQADEVASGAVPGS